MAYIITSVMGKIGLSYPQVVMANPTPNCYIKDMKQTLQTIKPNTPDKYQWKGNAKQKQAMSNWLTPHSETFGNAYKSFKIAGFSESYSKNIVGQAPKWISEYLDRTNFTDEHVLAALQEIATGKNLDSRSPADTQVKALEIIGKIKGMIDNGKGMTTNVVVQPILNGESVRPKQVTVDVTPTD